MKNISINKSETNKVSVTKGNDLCPAYPDIWRKGEICAIISHTGDGKSVLAETIAVECNGEGGKVECYIDDHNRDFFYDRLGESPYIHFKDAALWGTEMITNYIGWVAGPIVVDLNSPSNEKAKAVGNALYKAMTDHSHSYPLITIQAGHSMEEQIKLFHATRLTLLERIEGIPGDERFRATVNWRTPDEYSYELKVDTSNGVKMVRI